jgi:hypothetical protein
MTARERAIEYIHGIAPPPVAADDRVHGHSSGAPVVGNSWATQMPNNVPLLDDEVQQIAGVRKLNPTLLPTFLNNMKRRASNSSASINQFWPPLPADD